MVWSSPRVRELAGSFVPVAEKVEPYQKSRPKESPEAEYFWKLSAQSGSALPGQGIYVSTPSGKLLAFRQVDHDPESIAELLGNALAQWNRLDRKDRLLAGAPARLPVADWRPESRPPQGGLVLRLFVRDLPRDKGQPAEKFARMWNQDCVWFTGDEARSMVPASKSPTESHRVPEKLVRRLAKLHFLDLVRGIISPFDDREVTRAEMTVTVSGVEGDRVSLRLEGATRADRPGKRKPERDRDFPCGYEGKITGRATYDARQGKFASFEMLSIGKRWGGTLHNTRTEDNDLAPNPIGFALRMATDAEASSGMAPLHATDYFDQ